MLRRCAWCRSDMGSKEAQGDDHVTHGICLRCCEEILQAARREVRASTRPSWQGSSKAEAPSLVEQRLADQTLHLPAETLHD